MIYRVLQRHAAIDALSAMVIVDRSQSLCGVPAGFEFKARNSDRSRRSAVAGERVTILYAVAFVFELLASVVTHAMIAAGHGRPRGRKHSREKASRYRGAADRPEYSSWLERVTRE